MTRDTDMPTGLTPKQRATLQRCRRVAQLLDQTFRVPGTGYRIGIEAVVGLLPIAGDLVGGLLSLYIVVEAIRVDAPRSTLVRMLVNLAIDSVIGSIPIVGDVFDVVWKANRRNVALLETHLEKTGSE